jgi:hypothetical protein
MFEGMHAYEPQTYRGENKLTQIVSSLLSTCHHYVRFSKEYIQEDTSIETTIPISYADPIQVKNYSSQLENMFLFQIQSLIDCIQVLGISESARLGHLVSQIDFNSFYQNQLPQPSFILNPIVPVSNK